MFSLALALNPATRSKTTAAAQAEGVGSRRLWATKRLDSRSSDEMGETEETTAGRKS